MNSDDGREITKKTRNRSPSAGIDAGRVGTELEGKHEPGRSPTDKAEQEMTVIGRGFQVKIRGISAILGVVTLFVISVSSVCIMLSFFPGFVGELVAQVFRSAAG